MPRRSIESPASADSPRVPVFAYASLLLLAIAVYAPTLTHQFVWDDLEQVRDNDVIRHWSSFFDFWHKDILELSRKGGQHHSNYYRPLFYVQYLIYYQLFGLNTVAWHAMAILHHWLASAAALLFLTRLRFSLTIAWAAALLFVVHPAHGESVSWVAAAFNDPPAATCLLLALSAHVNWIRTGRARDARFAALGYAAGLCLKESALSMLLLVPLVEWYAAPGVPLKTRLARYAPYLGMTVIYFFVRLLALGSAVGKYPGAKSWIELLPTLPLLAVFYVRLLLWPFSMAPSYPLRYVEGWSQTAAWASVLGLAVLVLVLALLTRRRRALAFSCLWVACCVWPVFNIRSFLPTFLAHQRYLYLASLGVCLALAWLVAQIIQRPAPRNAVLALILAVWSGSNLYYNPAWKTDSALWTRIGEVDPHNPAGFDWLGARAMEVNNFDEAERLFRESVVADPSSPYSYQNLAVLYYPKRRQPATAMAWYQRAIDAFQRRNNWWEVEDLLKARMNYAACLAELGRTTEALDVFQSVAETPPYPPDAAKNAATLLRQMNRMEPIEPILKAAVERHPADVSLLFMLVDYYRLTGRMKVAAPYAQRLSEIAPNNPDVRALLQSFR